MTTGRLEYPFVRNAWMAGTWPYTVFLLVALGVDSLLRITREAEFDIAYSRFLSGEIDAGQLPNYGWFPLVSVLLIIQIIRLVLRRLVRSPMLTLDGETIRASFTESEVKRVDSDRVTEIQVDEKHQLIRFFVPDGLSLAVRADLLEANATGAVDLAQRFASELDVPVVPVRRWLWRWTAERLPTGV